MQGQATEIHQNPLASQLTVLPCYELGSYVLDASLLYPCRTTMSKLG